RCAKIMVVSISMRCATSMRRLARGVNCPMNTAKIRSRPDGGRSAGSALLCCRSKFWHRHARRATGIQPGGSLELECRRHAGVGGGCMCRSGAGRIGAEGEVAIVIIEPAIGLQPAVGADIPGRIALEAPVIG